MDTIEAIRTRRSVRSFRPERVPRDVIQSLVADAAQAPPPFSGQVPWTFCVLEGADRIAALGDEAKRYAQDHRPSGPGWSWADNPDFKVFWNAPVVIVIAGPIPDCCRAGQNMMLSAHARGLGTCWVGAPLLWLGSASGKKAFAIPPGIEAGAVLCLGYAQEMPARAPRGEPVIVWVP